MWHRLHAKTQQHDGHGSRGPRPVIPGTLVGLTVDRLPGRNRVPKNLWLWWTGSPGHTLDPDVLWRDYTGRFAIEHTFRFARQTLNWTRSRPDAPQAVRKEVTGLGACGFGAVDCPLLGAVAAWMRHPPWML